VERGTVAERIGDISRRLNADFGTTVPTDL
jgi:hypothetical protein